MPKEVYAKDKNFIFVDKCNRFVYERLIFVNFNGVFSMVKHDFYYTFQEIKNVVEYFKVSEYIDIECRLYSAPKRWIIDNDYTPYIKPEKKKRKYTKKIKESEQTIEVVE